MSRGVMKRILHRSNLHYHIGLRSFYFAFPVAGWLVGPEACFGTTLLLLAIFYYSDHTVNVSKKYQNAQKVHKV